MLRTTLLVLFALAAGVSLAADGDTVFHSDVSLVRVDTQVVDRDNHAVTGLHAEDFVLRDEGRPQPISNFSSEEMPVDLLLLLDVSRSMQPHIKHVASAAHKAFQVLRDQDRVAIMVFDRQARLRLPYRFSRDEAERELTALLKNEAFDGGTDITKGMLAAANYVAQHARPEARRAIVIVTDDRSQGDRDEAAVDRALTKADAVLCSLIAPQASRSGYGPGGGGRRGGGGGGGGGWGGGGVGWPGGGGSGWPGGGGGGRRGGGNGTSGNGQGSGGQTHSAGTAEIARDSGGDSLSLSEASALETTLTRIRQRYALHFHMPPDVKPGQERNIELSLTPAARQRYPEADLRYRRVYLGPEAATAPNAAPPAATPAAAPAVRDSDTPAPRRRPAVNEPVGPPGAITPNDTPDPGASQPPPAPTPPPAADQGTPGGWPRAKPGE
jgi:VWFA-related protein